MSVTISPEFLGHVLVWLQREVDDHATEVFSVEGSGSGWQGSTEGGFYDVFSVEITYGRKPGSRGGDKGWVECQGERMASLWDWVVNR